MNRRTDRLKEEMKEGLPYSIDENGIKVYFTTGYPTFQEEFQDHLLLKRTSVEEVLNNYGHDALASVIHQVDDEERKQANIIETVQTDESGTEKLVIAMIDDVILSVERVKYDEGKSAYVATEELFRKKMARGEAISLKSILPEGSSKIQISGEYVYKFENETEPYEFHYPLLKERMYADPKIEFLQGFSVMKEEEE